MFLDRLHGQCAQPNRETSLREEDSTSLFRDDRKSPVMPSCIYIDCTETYLSGLNTGIQRVVKNIIMRTPILQNHFDISFVPVIAVGDNYISLPNLKKIDWYFKKGRVIREKLKELYLNLEKVIKKHKIQNTEGTSSLSTDVSWIYTVAVSVFNWVFFFPIVILSWVERIKGGAIYPKSGEMIFIPDVFWKDSPVINSAEKASKNGAVVIPLIHDIFPLLNPDYMHALFVEQFSKGLSRLLEASAGILTTSKTMQEEIGKYLSAFSSDKAKTLPISFSYLGCDIDLKSEIVQFCSLDDFPFQDRTSIPYYLMVGTIEPRKGHEVALNAFESLWKEGEQVVLVIVGRIGWKCQRTLDALKMSPYRDKFLFFYNDISDQNLDCLYKMANGLVFPSLNEGFGLPLVEAMHYGVPVIASDLPVFHEIAKEYPYYFRTGDSRDLARVIKEHIHEISVSKKKLQPQEWLTWDDATKNFITKLIDFYRNHIVFERGY